MKQVSLVSLLLTLLQWGTSSAFMTAPFSSNQHNLHSTVLFSSTDEAVELSIDLPPSGSDVKAMMRIKPCLNEPSEFIEVRYKIPFDLSVEPKNNFAICTKAGSGGEQVGDILRFTSQWTLGLPRGEGLAQSAGAFGGALQWGCSMFDVMAAQDWRQVVEALTTNIPSRTDEVVLIFERAIKEEE